MTQTKTTRYVVTERGNGLPDVGDLVILDHDHGWHRLLVVTATGRIETHQPGDGNTMAVECAPAAVDWDDWSEGRQDEAWESLHHVAPIAEAVR